MCKILGYVVVNSRRFNGFNVSGNDINIIYRKSSSCESNVGPNRLKRLPGYKKINMTTNFLSSHIHLSKVLE